MEKKTHHVIPAPQGGWNIVKEGAKRATKRYKRKEDAIKDARQMSRNQGTKLVIHNEDGTIARIASFGVDPLPPRELDTFR